MQPIEVPQLLFLIFTIAIVLSVVVQTVVTVMLILTARKAVEKIEDLTDTLSLRALPLIAQSRLIIEDMSPKLRVISANLVEISTTLKNQTTHVNSTVGEVVDKTRNQAERVDEMVTAVLNSMAHAGETIHAGVSKPVRQVNGVLNALRAGLESYFAKSAPAPHRYTNGATASESHVHSSV
jgi:methyl-accepting chemotaxis protein